MSQQQESDSPNDRLAVPGLSCFKHNYAKITDLKGVLQEYGKGVGFL